MKQGLSRSTILLLLNMIIIVLLIILKGDIFYQWSNIKAVLSLMIYDLLLASAMTFVLVIGGIDLSVGAVVGLTSIIMASLLKNSIPISISLILGMSVAAFIGFCNGFLVSKLKIAPFLVTLATMSVVRGIAIVATKGRQISFASQVNWFTATSRAEIAITNTVSIPVLLIFAIIIVLVLHFLLVYNKNFYQLFYIGQNENVARLSGIRTSYMIIFVYILSACLTCISAIFILSNTKIGFANYSIGAEMRAIAAAVLGGCVMSGGKGSMIGSALGVLLLALVSNGFVLLNGSPSWQQSIIGAILLLTIIFDYINNQYFTKRKRS